MTVDSEEIKESIRAVQEQFAEAKFEADKQADEIVTAFCEGQRKHFQHLISLRKTNQGEKEHVWVGLKVCQILVIIIQPDKILK